MSDAPTLSNAESLQTRRDDYILSGISLNTSSVGLTAYISVKKQYPNSLEGLTTTVALPDDLRERLYQWFNEEKTNMIWERR